MVSFQSGGHEQTHAEDQSHNSEVRLMLRGGVCQLFWT
jgi:hypothetical protein